MIGLDIVDEQNFRAVKKMRFVRFVDFAHQKFRSGGKRARFVFADGHGAQNMAHAVSDAGQNKTDGGGGRALAVRSAHGNAERVRVCKTRQNFAARTCDPQCFGRRAFGIAGLYRRRIDDQVGAGDIFCRLAGKYLNPARRPKRLALCAHMRIAARYRHPHFRQIQRQTVHARACDAHKMYLHPFSVSRPAHIPPIRATPPRRGLRRRRRKRQKAAATGSSCGAFAQKRKIAQKTIAPQARNGGGAKPGHLKRMRKKTCDARNRTIAPEMPRYGAAAPNNAMTSSRNIYPAQPSANTMQNIPKRT